MYRITLICPYRDVDSRQPLIEADMIDVFGGFTRVHAQGAWEDPNGKVHWDDNWQYTVTTDEDIALVTKAVAGISNTIKVAFKQQEVYSLIEVVALAEQPSICDVCGEILDKEGGCPIEKTVRLNWIDRRSTNGEPIRPTSAGSP